MIQGYPDDASVFPGDVVIFHVSTDAPEFRIDFYRQGATLDFVLSTDWMKGMFADVHEPDQDWGQAAVRRDGKAVAAWPQYPFKVPVGWRTGAYVAMFIEGDGLGNQSPTQTPPLDPTTADARTGKALLVVRNPTPGVASQLLYKLPYFTYQMYNASYYTREDNGARGGGSGYQGFAVSLHRPGGGTGGTPWDIVERAYPSPSAVRR